MTKRNPRSKKAASARLLRTPLLVALSAPALLASAAAVASAQPRQSNMELDQGRLADVRGGAAFLSGALTAGEAATPSLESPGTNGFIMRDTIIIRTSGL